MGEEWTGAPGVFVPLWLGRLARFRVERLFAPTCELIGSIANVAVPSTFQIS